MWDPCPHGQIQKLIGLVEGGLGAFKQSLSCQKGFPQQEKVCLSRRVEGEIKTLGREMGGGGSVQAIGHSPNTSQGS